MADKSPPEGSFDFDMVTQLSEKDAEYVATWMAEAFSKTDCLPYIATGKTFADDPHAHYLWFRSLLDRTAGAGYLVVNKTRTAMRVMFPPGKKDERLDMSYVTPHDENWKLFLERCSGAEAVKARISPLRARIAESLKTVYGEDAGLSHFRTAGFAVHPGCQGQGLGAAMHSYIANTAKRADKKWHFTAVERVVSRSPSTALALTPTDITATKLPYYGRLGCKIVGEKIPTGIDEVGRQAYPPGNDFKWLCEVSPA
ncbi:hypothetical protein P389DRAFT_197220 [Cystobasidium minutum MCA 4210]|uniref:uncharacterized protein n=1 Tax=Cystobasidium minutum MCA 4210 TaxID=1397322 RepID=UPI0034CEB30D|eukprot:jgi/Rhomi1/197220/gm1.5434_g